MTEKKASGFFTLDALAQAQARPKKERTDTGPSSAILGASTVTAEELAPTLFASMMRHKIFRDRADAPNCLLISGTDIPTEMRNGVTAKTIEEALNIVARTVNRTLDIGDDLYENTTVYMNKGEGLYGLNFCENFEQDEIISSLEYNQQLITDQLMELLPTLSLEQNDDPDQVRVLNSSELAKSMIKCFVQRDFVAHGPTHSTLDVRLSDIENALARNETCSYAIAEEAAKKLARALGAVLGCDHPGYDQFDYKTSQNPLVITDSTLSLILPNDVLDDLGDPRGLIRERFEFINDAIDLVDGFPEKTATLTNHPDDDDDIAGSKPQSKGRVLN